MLLALKQLRWLIVLTSLVMVMPAYSYLDGNSGSIIVQALLGGVAGLLAIGKFYWLKLKTFVLRLFGKTPAELEPLDHSAADDKPSKTDYKPTKKS